MTLSSWPTEYVLSIVFFPLYRLFILPLYVANLPLTPLPPYPPSACPGWRLQSHQDSNGSSTLCCSPGGRVDPCRWYQVQESRKSINQFCIICSDIAVVWAFEDVASYLAPCSDTHFPPSNPTKLTVDKVDLLCTPWLGKGPASQARSE